MPPYERNLCYRKSGCHWRVGRLQRNNKADSTCGNTAIPQELLILLPMAARTLPARPVCWHPIVWQWQWGLQELVQCGARNACPGGWLRAGRRRGQSKGITGRCWSHLCLEKALHAAQLFVWCLMMVVGSHNGSVCLVGEKSPW